MVDAPTNRRRIAILTRDGPEHRYVVNALCAAIPVDRIIIDRRPTRVNVRRAMRQGFGHFLSKVARALLLKVIGDGAARARALGRLFGDKGRVFDALDKIDSVDGVNSSETIALLKQINPDVILVYGTSVVKNSVLGLSRELCFNMHTGISPYYRGTACSFWPIVNGQFEMLGATIHECTSRIDGGKVFEIARVAYQPGDGLHTIFGRAVIAGAEAYGRVLNLYLADRLEGVAQDLSLGREYRGSELTLVPELTARVRLARTGICAALCLGARDMK